MRSLHPSPRIPRCLIGVVCLLPLVLTGCGDGVKLYPVTGKVTLGGSPMTAGTVKFWAEGGTEVVAAGPINSDGTYQVLTKNKNGAPLGKYKVTVSASGPPAPGSIQGTPDPTKLPSLQMTDVPPMYTNEKTTKLNLEVTAEPSATQYDLNLLK